MNLQLNDLNWKKMDGLLPAIIQDNRTGKVLMLGYMNEEALAITLETKQVTFFSRSKQRLWRKGETSHNTMQVDFIAADCDGDSLLVQVTPAGPACHLGLASCFQPIESQFNFLHELIQLIAQRSKNSNPSSYTTQLLTSGVARCAQKVGEEAVETVIAAVGNQQEELISEASDLLFHLLVLLQACEISFYDLITCLQQRHRK
ncbi:bifunctional phosphoribosyl-AMP cyclohydrolase/phosphoribosyl-ATP diphosphatase HisIE [Legionella hackeliae]|uniref:Histidine biosynthesis bifunctional protein HisIE n=1 Tax=Legionella hackeliae TaxID=449 RepID=A0A0A8UUI2_LEGHA|nr:bifunctional phosphoribosyl-AMP cyclohydrolase/phosphoribosyl-ATP diphosphatase HisIE [Legionella hackeliae]KTD13745.1 bifunctional phosphoribosyl-AMP cyclohydrolase/phosphoribosyl-ATP pyrophosphatase protein [Legionella hackeliae]CEK10444.1 Histidine biosynthesis bifunctional protein hisIE [Includes: Phosphoribosyl-AMP cyclohydrolase; Phosphoribosyl-ATP pyrophosphatase] [Legionella hackeliae]STX47180.1 phosphoribosyl-ATP pyrophosphohydrolase [Legionella hackeliae]